MDCSASTDIIYPDSEAMLSTLQFIIAWSGNDFFFFPHLKAICNLIFCVCDAYLQSDSVWLIVQKQFAAIYESVRELVDVVYTSVVVVFEERYPWSIPRLAPKAA